MVLNGHGTTGSWGLTDGDILVKGRRARNGRFVDTLVLPDRVRSSIACEGTLYGAKAWRRRAVLNNIVFN